MLAVWVCSRWSRTPAAPAVFSAAPCVVGRKYFHYCAAGTAACAEVPGMLYVGHDICNTVCGYRNIDHRMPR